MILVQLGASTGVGASGGFGGPSGEGVVVTAAVAE